MNIHRILLIAMLAACGTPWLSAHHSIRGKYDSSSTVSLTGVLAKVELVNPHVRIELSGQDVDRKVTTWLIEMASPYSLLQRNFDMKLLGVGRPVTLEAW